MLVKKNSKEFKKVKEIYEELLESPVIKRSIQLYLVKAGSSINSRIKLSSSMKNADILFQFQIEAITFSFLDRSFKLHRSEKVEGLYFFKSASDSDWDQNPFEFKGKYRDQLKEFWGSKKMKVVRS